MEQNKISRRNFLRVAGASATAAAMGGLVPAASAAGIKDLWSMDLQILATSDTHGKFDPWDYAANKADASGSVAQQATAIKENRTKTTLVVDAGDTIQANSAELFLNDDVHPMIAAQNAIGYDVYVTGNHEYNYGMATLEKVLSQQKAKVLTGNVYSPEGKPLADGYTIINKGGVKIGVIGMVTPNITRWDAKNLEGWTVTNPVDESRKIIDKIKNDVDVIIGVMHMDVDNEYGVYGSGVTDLANACPEFDVIVAAHGHKSIPNKMINGVLVVENKNAGATVSDIHVYLERGLNGKWKVKDRTSENLIIKDYAPDPELTALLAEYDQRAKDDAVTPIGQLVGGDLAPENEIDCLPQAMVQDTALLDFINEVQMYYTDAQVAATALTSMTSQMREGTIRKCDMASIYTYQNTLYKLQMNGWQLRQFMEWSAAFFKTWEPGDVTIAFDSSVRYYLYDAFAGVKYDLDISKQPGNRIQNLTIKDYAPDPELTALLAEYDQRAKDDAVTPIGQLVGGDLAPENEIDCLPQAMVQDTALLDFVNEVQMYYTGAQVAATSLTSMTSQMREGTIRKCDMASIYTYQNTLYKLQMNGLQLRKFMEWSAAFFKTWEPGDVTIAFDSSIRYYLYDAFEGVKYDLDVSQQPGNRIHNLTWMDGRPVEDSDVFVVAVNNYRATTQLLTYADIFAPGDELPKLLEIDVRGDVGGVRELLGEYIRTVKGGTIEPHVDNNWKLVGNNWNAADHEKAVKLLREGKLALSENADSRTLPGKAITTADIAAF